VRHSTTHHIRTTLVPPVALRPRRLAPDRLAAAKADFNAMLQDCTARPSKGPWSSALRHVHKKDSGCRLCGDYRALNPRTIPDRYPVPHTRLLLPPSCCTIFSKIVLVKAYHSILVYPDDIKKDNYHHNFRFFDFLYMSIGLRNTAKLSNTSWMRFSKIWISVSPVQTTPCL